ncbi:flavodoxin [Desulfovibrio sp. OttesenSCG-928-A18]|nr:flavodoxin [Desulfovibrio sp. OttesenSCG-928-A18]
MKMNRRNFVFTILAAGAAVTGSLLIGGAFPQNAIAAEAGGKKALVIFYSWSGNTRGVATEIHKKVGGDLIELELVKPYSTNYNTCLDEAQRDQRQEARPELKTKIADISQYDVVYLGYPNWWATIPMPIATLLESYDFSGKIIAPFCSHGGGRLGQSVTDIAKLAPGAKITEGLSVHYSGGSSLSRDIDNWFQKNGLGA